MAMATAVFVYVVVFGGVLWARSAIRRAANMGYRFALRELLHGHREDHSVEDVIAHADLMLFNASYDSFDAYEHIASWLAEPLVKR